MDFPITDDNRNETMIAIINSSVQAYTALLVDDVARSKSNYISLLVARQELMHDTMTLYIRQLTTPNK